MMSRKEDSLEIFQDIARKLGKTTEELELSLKIFARLGEEVIQRGMSLEELNDRVKQCSDVKDFMTFPELVENINRLNEIGEV
tara:strand:- start:111 stop:359 length:249 start_codon:yes stop_codon:yes gene_type:complete